MIKEKIENLKSAAQNLTNHVKKYDNLEIIPILKELEKYLYQDNVCQMAYQSLTKVKNSYVQTITEYSDNVIKITQEFWNLNAQIDEIIQDGDCLYKEILAKDTSL